MLLFIDIYLVLGGNVFTIVDVHLEEDHARVLTHLLQVWRNHLARAAPNVQFVYRIYRYNANVSNHSNFLILIYNRLVQNLLS